MRTYYRMSSVREHRGIRWNPVLRRSKKGQKVGLDFQLLIFSTEQFPMAEVSAFLWMKFFLPFFLYFSSRLTSILNLGIVCVHLFM